jgi:hypothetical protein
MDVVAERNSLANLAILTFTNANANARCAPASCKSPAHVHEADHQ